MGWQQASKGRPEPQEQSYICNISELKSEFYICAIEYAIMSGSRLFYIIGASGCGKTALLHYARERLPNHTNLLVAHRYITRRELAEDGNHVLLSEAEFGQRLSHDCFAMHWYSHGCSFGIGIEIHQWLSKGLDVAVIGTRSNLDQLHSSYPELQPILIRAKTELLERRLRMLGLTDPIAIARRIQRSYEFENIEHPRLITVDNNGLLQSAGDRLLDVLSDSGRAACA
jgi:ribose 1,5-bisphosphokinase